MTDGSNRPRSPKLALSRLEWKLGLTAVLGLTYALTLISVAKPPASAPADPGPLSAAPVASYAAPSSAGPAIQSQPTIPLRMAQPRIRTRSS